MKPEYVTFLMVEPIIMSSKNREKHGCLEYNIVQCFRLDIKTDYCKLVIAFWS